MKTSERIAIALCLILTASPSWAKSLHEAVRDGDILAAEQLISEGEGVEEQDEAALTPLVTAALAGQMESVVLLIDKGADPSGRDGNGYTALHAAAHAGHLDVVELLIGYGVDTNDQENKAGIAPLHAAAERGFQDIAELLLREGADVGVRTPTGHTPVVMAVLNTHPAMVKLLREHGANCSKIKLVKYRKYCMNAGT